MQLNSGVRLAHYEISGPLGSGGMGAVYRARDTKLGRDVAIPDGAGTPTRGYEIRLVSTLPPDSVRANGATAGWQYDGPTLTTVITVPPRPVNERVEVLVRSAAASAALVSGVRGQLARLRTAMDILNTSWPNGWSPDLLIEAAQAGRRMTLQPSTARAELEKLKREMPAIIEAIAKMEVDCRATAIALRQLGRATTCVPAMK